MDELFERDLSNDLVERGAAEDAAARARLKQCIKCVGNERNHGSNIKDSASYCNKICKRELNLEDLNELVERDISTSEENDDEDSPLGYIFETRGVAEDAAARARLKQCITCVGNERVKGSNIKTSATYCNKICKRGVQYGNFKPKPKN